jgi:hypothetical protein
VVVVDCKSRFKITESALPLQKKTAGSSRTRSNGPLFSTEIRYNALHMQEAGAWRLELSELPRRLLCCVEAMCVGVGEMFCEWFGANVIFAPCAPI